MKSRICFPHLSAPYRTEHRSFAFSPVIKRLDGTRARRQRHLLLGVSILLIICWVVGAIWLISARRRERSTADVRAQQKAIVIVFPSEMNGQSLTGR